MFLISFEIILIFVLIIALILFITKNTHTRQFVDKDAKIIKDSVAEQLYLTLGGIKQWVLLRGSSTNNPVLIFLHGGPGISLHALFRYFHHELEDHFIVIGWDQRGSGKSYNKSISPESITVDQFVSDLHELVTYLKKKFNQDKVYILGESWGALLGTIYTNKYPEDVAAYIGTGQVSNQIEAERLGCEFVLEQAKKRNNKNAIQKLQKLSQPSCNNAQEVGIQRKLLMKFGGCLYRQKGYLPWILKMLTIDEYAWPDLLKIGSGSKMSMKYLWPQIFHTNLFIQISELNCPIYFLMGRHDYQVSAKLAGQYFDFLKAHKKELVWFENSGHNPMFEEPTKFTKALLSIRYGKSL